MAVDCRSASRVVLRVIQVVFALICFAPAAWLQNTYYVPSSVKFTVFVGVTAFLIAIFYTLVSCVEGLQRTFWGLIEVVINGIWVVFWLASAASLAAFAPCKPSQASLGTFSDCDKFLASQAFAWMSWLLWCASLVIAFLDMRQGKGITGGNRNNYAASGYPQGPGRV